MQEAYCRWYEKAMKNLTEHEQEQCAENGQLCDGCPDLILKEMEEDANRNLGNDMQGHRRV